MHICIYEDQWIDGFVPFSLMRPVYLLRPGIQPQYERIARWLGASDLSLASRDSVAGLVAEEARDVPVNILKRPESGTVLFVNGRLRHPGDLLAGIEQSQMSTRFHSGDETAALYLKGDLVAALPPIGTMSDIERIVAGFDDSLPVATLRTSAQLYRYHWQVMADIGSAISDDFAALTGSQTAALNNATFEGVYLIEPDRIRLSQGVSIGPASVLDASGGPVYIGANTTIDSHVSITGPCFVGANSHVVAGKIASSSIGHTSRVGGEVEETIFHAYVNKYHAGFIGHSYVGPWVNFGAMTTNSDLKNNYSNIRCTLNGESIDTGSIKVGSFIGDHTKFGIGTLLNTGITIGISCNLFGGALIADKEVPSFSWGNTGNYQPYDFDKAIKTIERSMERRNVELSKNQLSLLADVHAGECNRKGVLDI